MGETLAKKNISENCIICEQPKILGIHLYTSFICSDCEKDIVQTDTNDPKYEYYINQLKLVIKPEIYS
ncbi:sigma factor G inhibitor Gin [Heyndrickxia vini]|uniref:Sigma factor G inhibitor Gin n=1 Tax=Heyndrickxia vini TaxID=1476025 RepID=A0ABX7E172_9BACI|nr:sigma factor G inhibitor Gin [Heyndrickxia vini]QQZ09473.1 sigma factor G inhibitor Gin [Heyndrickxia vini]